jgi:hypothetical protein
MPVFLILYDAILEEAYWLHIQAYAQQHGTEVRGETVQVRIPQYQVLGIGAIRLMRERKQQVLAALKGKGGER